MENGGQLAPRKRGLEEKIDQTLVQVPESPYSLGFRMFKYNKPKPAIASA